MTDNIEETLRVGKRGRLTVPKDIRDDYNIGQGDRVNVTFHIEPDE